MPFAAEERDHKSVSAKAPDCSGENQPHGTKMTGAHHVGTVTNSGAQDPSGEPGFCWGSSVVGVGRMPTVSTSK